MKENESCNKFLMAYYVQGANRLLELMMGTTRKALRRAGDSNCRQSGTQGDAPLIGATRGTRGKSVKNATGDRESRFRGHGAGKARGLQLREHAAQRARTGDVDTAISNGLCAGSMAPAYGVRASIRL